MIKKHIFSNTHQNCAHKLSAETKKFWSFANNQLIFPSVSHIRILLSFFALCTLNFLYADSLESRCG